MKRAILVLFPVTLFFIAGTVMANPTIKTFVSTCTGTNTANQIELRYDVPVPGLDNEIKNTDTKYRSYAAIIGRIHNLAALDNDIVTQYNIGSATANATEIWAMKISTSSPTKKDGSKKTAILITGGVHAREWIGPEVAMRIAEDIIQKYNENNSEIKGRLENCEVWVVPVVNPEGFIYTQQNHDKAIVYDSYGTRDGRYRRKNMRNKSFDFPTQAWLDIPGNENKPLAGVDINRNFPYGYGSIPSSNDPLSPGYKGTSILSESESATLKTLIDNQTFDLRSKIRVFIDYHSYNETITLPLINLDNMTNTELRNKIADGTLKLIANAIAAAGHAYTKNYCAETDNQLIIPKPDNSINYCPGGETFWGALDEFMSKEIKCPSFTIELRPIDDNNWDYGFILPVTRDNINVFDNCVSENIAGFLKALEWSCDRRYGKEFSIYIEEQNPVYSAIWWPVFQSDGYYYATSRDLVVTQNKWLVASAYNVKLNFNQSMMTLDNEGVPVSPEITFGRSGEYSEHEIITSGTWSSTLYDNDTWTGYFTIPSGYSGDYDGKTVRFNIKAKSETGENIDGNPGTIVDMVDGIWTNFEDGLNPSQDYEGGSDISHAIKIDTLRPVPEKD
jgi:hypothetical protein